MKKAIAAIAMAAAVLAGGTAVAAKMSKSVPKGWIEDFEVAKKTAKQEKKHILIAFSGSDWCGWCIKMDREIYSDKKFVSNAKKDFVLVMIDKPRDKSILSKTALRQNDGLREKYNIHGYPCSIVTTDDGTEVKRFGGYQRGGPEAFLKSLKETLPDEKAEDKASAKEAK